MAIPVCIPYDEVSRETTTGVSTNWVVGGVSTVAPVKAGAQTKLDHVHAKRE